MKRIEKLNKWSKLSDKDKSDKIVNEMDWTEKDQKSWEKFKKNLPNLIKEGIVFSIAGTIFLLIVGYFLYKLLEVIYNI
jgi:hypothetical protein